MSDGTLSVRRRQAKASEQTGDEPFSLASLRAGSFESFLGSGHGLPTIGKGLSRDKGKAKARPTGDVGEFKVEARRRRKLRGYDRLLKNFKYSAALDTVLRKVRNDASSRVLPTLLTCENSIADEQQVPPTISFSLIQELVHRDGLRTALAGRDDVLLEPTLQLLVKYVADPRFGDLASSVAALVLGAPKRSSFGIEAAYTHCTFVPLQTCMLPYSASLRS